MAFVESLPTFFGDFGITATVGSLSTLCFFDAPDEDEIGGRIRGAEYSITFQTGALGPLPRGTPVTVKGANFIVLDVKALEDGLVQRARLELVTNQAWDWSNPAMDFGNPIYTMDGGWLY